MIRMFQLERCTREYDLLVHFGRVTILISNARAEQASASFEANIRNFDNPIQQPLPVGGSILSQRISLRDRAMFIAFARSSGVESPRPRVQ
jgi:hypothetical protein